MSREAHPHLISGDPMREHRLSHERHAFAQLRVHFDRESPIGNKWRRRGAAEFSQWGLQVRARGVVRGTRIIVTSAAVGHNALVRRHGNVRARVLARRRRRGCGACGMSSPKAPPAFTKKAPPGPRFVRRGVRGPERLLNEACGLHGASEVRVHQAGHR